SAHGKGVVEGCQTLSAVPRGRAGRRPLSNERSGRRLCDVSRAGVGDRVVHVIAGQRGIHIAADHRRPGIPDGFSAITRAAAVP
ncbi:MAG: hypothetical protein ACRDTD_25975, partial [Pseudonocardiaceae bacterium]